LEHESAAAAAGIASATTPNAPTRNLLNADPFPLLNEAAIPTARNGRADPTDARLTLAAPTGRQPEDEGVDTAAARETLTWSRRGTDRFGESPGRPDVQMRAAATRFGAEVC
jgi:hypothetical protein